MMDSRRRRLQSVPLQPVRPLSCAYKAHPLTRPDARRLERPAVIETAFRDWQTRALPLDDGRELVDGPRIELGRNAILQGSPAPQCPPPLNFKTKIAAAGLSPVSGSGLPPNLPCGGAGRSRAEGK